MASADFATDSASCCRRRNRSASGSCRARRGGEAEAAEEGARLVWVGATRAMERLILSGTFKRKQRLGRRALVGRRRPRAVASGARRARLGRGEPRCRDRSRSGPVGRRRRRPRRAREPATGGQRAERRTGAGARPGTTAPRGRAVARCRGGGRTAGASRAGASGRPSLLLRARRLRALRLPFLRRADARPREPPGRLHPDAGGEQVGADSPGAIDAASRGRGFGNAVHAALEWSAAADWKPPSDDRLSRLLETELVTGPGELERAREMIDGWLASSLLAELRGAETRAEVPFALAIGQAIVRGQIDLLVLGERSAGAGARAARAARRRSWHRPDDRRRLQDRPARRRSAGDARRSLPGPARALRPGARCDRKRRRGGDRGAGDPRLLGGAGRARQ